MDLRAKWCGRIDGLDRSAFPIRCRSEQALVDGYDDTTHYLDRYCTWINCYIQPFQHSNTELNSNSARATNKREVFGIEVRNQWGIKRSASDTTIATR